MIPPNVNCRHAHALLLQLAACGARRVVITPGSRSTPLAWTAVNLPEFATYTLIDERSAAFFALGLSKADGVPAILVCTSGTAAANYFPAVIEAAQAGTPLLLLTADRPAALRGRGAPQTINQDNLYGCYPRYFAELPAACDSGEHFARVQAIAAAAYTAATGNPPGPAHINVPLDEPLAPVPDVQSIDFCFPELEEGANAAAGSENPVSAEIVKRIDAALCGLIVLGPEAARTAADAEAIHRLGRTLGWPVMADILSGLRFHAPPVLPFYDVFLRDEHYAQLAPDVVLAFGRYPTSKTLNRYLNRHRAAFTVQFCGVNLPADPDNRATEFVKADAPECCGQISKSVTAARDSLLYAPFHDAASRMRAALNDTIAVEGGEAAAAFHAVTALADDANAVLANSMAVRYADALCCANGRSRRAFGLRGANGIDGTISHAAGVAAASGKPTLLITGDLAFVHDCTGLMAAARFAPTLTILLLDNNGGGIFHYLPAADCETAEQFEQIHGTPHDANLRAAAELFGLKWTELQSPDQIAAASFKGAQVFRLESRRETETARYKSILEKLMSAARG